MIVLVLWIFKGCDEINEGFGAANIKYCIALMWI